MAAGLAVISSGTGGASEIVRDGIDGLVFSTKDAKSLAERLLLLANHPEIFRELQDRAQRRSLDFSVEAAVKKIEFLIEEAVPSGPR